MEYDYRITLRQFDKVFQTYVTSARSRNAALYAAGRDHERLWPEVEVTRVDIEYMGGKKCPGNLYDFTVLAWMTGRVETGQVTAASRTEAINAAWKRHPDAMKIRLGPGRYNALQSSRPQP